MRKLSLLLCSLLLSTLANAASKIDIGTIECSGDQSVTLTEHVELSCSGNLSLLGVHIDAGERLIITARGSLSLDDSTTLNASSIGLHAFGGQPTFERGVPAGAASSAPGHAVAASHTNATPVALGRLDHPQSFAGGDIALASPGAVLITNRDGNAGQVPGIIELPSATGGQVIVRQTGSLSLSSGNIVLISAVPEPATYLSMLAGLLVIAARRRRQA